MQQSSTNERIKIHFNHAQLKIALIQARIMVAIWGRGTGKSSAAIAYFALMNILQMPKGNGAFVGTTFTQLLIRTIPEVIKGWERMGFKENVHFWVQKRPPANLKIPKGYTQPLQFDYYIKWYNGSGIYLISQDVKGSSNGLSLDWIVIDEAKFIDNRKFDEETTPTLRGNAEYFGHLSCHGSYLYATDMPTHPSQAWIFDLEKEVDKNIIKLILQVQKKIQQLKNEKPKLSVRIKTEIQKYEAHLNDLRKKAVYFSLASTFDNVHVLGLDSLKTMKKKLSDFLFQTTVLNIRQNLVENGFYALMNPNTHGYTAENYAYIKQHYNQERNCLWDSDVALSSPLDIAFDHNAAINSLVIGQSFGNTYKVIKAMYVLHPHRIKDLVDKFCKYYKGHLTKEVNYYFDATSVGSNAIDHDTFAGECIAQLEKRGWAVNTIYIEQIPTQHTRYNIWQSVFKGEDSKYQIFSYNKTNCRALETSMFNAEIKYNYSSKNKFGKDKRSERSKTIPAQDATHLSEAMDILMIGSQFHSAQRNTYRSSVIIS